MFNIIINELYASAASDFEVFKNLPGLDENEIDDAELLEIAKALARGNKQKSTPAESNPAKPNNLPDIREDKIDGAALLDVAKKPNLDNKQELDEVSLLIQLKTAISNCPDFHTIGKEKIKRAKEYHCQLLLY